MSKTTHYELNTPIGSEVLSVMTGLNPNFNTIDKTMYDNETRSTQALNKANVNEQNIATALGRITTAEGDIDTLESGLQTANTNISGLTSRMSTAETNIVSANNRIQENTGEITQIKSKLSEDNKLVNKYVTVVTDANGNFDLTTAYPEITPLNIVSILCDDTGATFEAIPYKYYNGVYVHVKGLYDNQSKVNTQVSLSINYTTSV